MTIMLTRAEFRHVAPRLPSTCWPAASSVTARPEVWVGAVMAVAAVLRLTAIGPSYDAFVDEFFYAHMSTLVLHGQLPPETAPGAPFLLHPPGYFVLGAAWEALWGPPGDQFGLVYLLRELNGVLGALSAGLVFVLTRPLAGRHAAWVAALLFALDPFVLRQNGRLLLDTAAMTAVLAGYALLLPVVMGSSGRPKPAAVAAGLVLGLAVLVKDMTAVLVVVPLAVVVLRRWIVPRRLGLLALGASALPYLSYLAYLAARGLLGPYLDAKTLGVRRLLGLVQVSGFNGQGSPSLAHTLLAQATTFGPTYLVILLGVAATIVLLRHRRAELRMLGMITAAAAGLVAYATLFGTSEEQFLYYLAVPAVISLVVAADDLLRRVPALGGVPRAAAAALVAVLVVANLAQWIAVRSSPDDGVRRAVTWLEQHAPDRTGVAVTTGGVELALEGTSLRPVRLGSPPAMAQSQVRYVVLQDKLVAQGYSYASPQTAAWLRQHGRTVFSFQGRSFGTTQIIETTDTQLW